MSSTTNTDTAVGKAENPPRQQSNSNSRPNKNNNGARRGGSAQQPPQQRYNLNDIKPRDQQTKKSGKPQQNKIATTTATILEANVEDEPGVERCIVCCERMDCCGLGECGHRICCGLCTFRLRLLHHDEKCVLCKAKLEKVFIIRLTEPRTFADFQKLVWGKIGGAGLVVDDRTANVGSAFFTEECLDFKQQIDSLREARCDECSPPVKFANVKSLERHLADVHHGKSICKLCLEHRGLFLMEHARMTPAELTAHYQRGDGTKSFEGHPTCKFCRNLSFYNTDQLYKHLNDAHETCHLCAKQGTRYQYFRDYPSLEIHFGQAHYLCDDPKCREQRFVNAFLTELQLQAHTATEHPERMRNPTASSLNLDFVVRGSRRAQAQYPEQEDDVFQPSRTPSPFAAAGAGFANASTLSRMASEDFPRLGVSSSSDSSSSSALPRLGPGMPAPSAAPNRRYLSQATSSYQRPGSSSNGGFLVGFRIWWILPRRSEFACGVANSNLGHALPGSFTPTCMTYCLGKSHGM
jgi:hypothetical protein